MLTDPTNMLGISLWKGKQSTLLTCSCTWVCLGKTWMSRLLKGLGVAYSWEEWLNQWEIVSTYLGLFNRYTHGAHCVPGTLWKMMQSAMLHWFCSRTGKNHHQETPIPHCNPWWTNSERPGAQLGLWRQGFLEKRRPMCPAGGTAKQFSCCGK